MQLIEILLVGVIFVLAVVSCFLFFSSRKITKQIDLLLEKGKVQDLRDTIFSQIEKTKEIELSLQRAFEKIAALEEISKISIQKIGVVRFDAFSRVGGNQSFAVAFLDKNDNGFVLSSLFAHESSKVYAKPITKGTSTFVISEEEQEAINKALKNHAS